MDTRKIPFLKIVTLFEEVHAMVDFYKKNLTNEPLTKLVGRGFYSNFVVHKGQSLLQSDDSLRKPERSESKIAEKMLQIILQAALKSSDCLDQ
ncbi:MAG: hypothetical protein KDK72_03375 [Chlamydiia bacterium]|nr:hypothetical protein [Chlamydiia bacterium]